MRTLSILFLVLTLVLWALPVHAGKQGSSQLETRTINLDSFSAIEIKGSFDVDIRFGSRQKVEITIDDNLWDVFNTRVRGQWLYLNWGRQCQPSSRCKVTLVVTNLTQVIANESGDVRIHKFDGYKFSYVLRGSGNLKMNGTVNNLDIHMNGTGFADVRKLKARTVDVAIVNSGDASVYATDRLRARISGLGILNYSGNPLHKDTRASGLGKIQRY